MKNTVVKQSIRFSLHSEIHLLVQVLSREFRLTKSICARAGIILMRLRYCIKKGTPIHPFNDGGAQENGMRAGTENVASIVGMATALKKNCSEIDQTSAALYKLEERLLSRLESAGVDFRRNGANNHAPGNISLSFKNASGEALLHRLDLKKICVSTGSACDSKNTQISHVLRAMQLPDEYARGTIRVSLGRNSTHDDINEIAEALISIVNNIRSKKS